MKALKQKHRRLDEMIRAETLHAAQNERAIRRLKEEKLHVKEEMERLKQHGDGTRH